DLAKRISATRGPISIECTFDPEMGSPTHLLALAIVVLCDSLFGGLGLRTCPIVAGCPAPGSKCALSSRCPVRAALAGSIDARPGSCGACWFHYRVHLWR